MEDKSIHADDKGDDIDDVVYTSKLVSSIVGKSFGFDISRDGEGGGNSAWTSEIDAFLDSATLKGLFYSEDWVYITIDLLANKISSQLMAVFKTVIEDEQDVTEQDTMHPLTAMLEQPNEWQDYHSFMYNVVVELFLMGNAVIWVNKRKGTLLILPAEQVTLDFNKDGSVKQYVMGSVSVDNQGLIQTNNEKSVVFPVDEIMHVRRPNPSSLLWGLSPLIAGRRSILFSRYSQEYLNSFYIKQATPALAIKIDRSVNEDVALRQLRAMEMMYTGRANQRRTMVLPKGVDVQPLSHSLADQRLIDHINSNRETILGLLKIPKHEVSLQTAGSLGSEEYKIALRNFWESTLKPAMRQLAGGFNKFFAKELGADHFFQFDLEDVEALQDDKEKRADIAIKLLAAGFSVNEARELFEKEPSTHPYADIPSLLIPNGIDASIGLPAPAALPALPATPDEAQLGYAEIESILTKAGSSLSMQTKQLDDEVSGIEDKFISSMLDRFVDMAELAIIAFKDNATETQPKKGLKTKAAEIKTSEMKRAIQRSIDSLEEQYVDDTTALLSSSVEFGYDTQLRFVINHESIDELTALRARDKKRRRLLLEARGIKSFSQITKTHTERIMGVITEGVDKQETIDQIARRIADTFADPANMLKKARTIARTETLTAVSQGQWAAVQNAKTVIPNLQKVWITAGDERVRDSHIENNGVRIDVDKEFSNGLRYPRDLQGLAAETINCRCTLIMAPKDEDLGDIPE